MNKITLTDNISDAVDMKDKIEDIIAPKLCMEIGLSDAIDDLKMNRSYAWNLVDEAIVLDT